MRSKARGLIWTVTGAQNPLKVVVSEQGSFVREATATVVPPIHAPAIQLTRQSVRKPQLWAGEMTSSIQQVSTRRQARRKSGQRTKLLMSISSPQLHH
jgi:hypothetical protein